MILCKFCSKECKNSNSVRQHQVRCKNNPDKIEIVSNFIKFHKEIKEGKREKLFFNQYDKALKLNLKKPIVSNETRKKLSERVRERENNGKGKTLEIENERKRKISQSLLGNKRSKGRGIKVKYKKYTFRSTWEYKVAIYLDLLGMIWGYEEQCFKIDEKRTYRPDFFIKDEQGNLEKIIEVKGYWFKDNKDKFEKFKLIYSIPIELWDKDKMKSLNLI
ncbi:MAG: hypothetical protein ABIP51_15055 [Bacteroidia bacterium]